MGTVVVAPYLPLRERVTVHPWSLIPASDLAASDLGDDVDRVAVRRLIAAYGAGTSNCGALAHETGARVGDDLRDDAGVERLHHTLVLAVLDANPAPGSTNSAWRTATADNALVWGHPFRDWRFTAVEEGALVPVLRGIDLTEEDPEQIAPPSELRLPEAFGPIDLELATAFYAEMGRDTQAARKLTRATAWLAFAWRNSTAITDDVRTVGLHTALEVVLADSPDPEPIRMARKLSNMLDPKAKATLRRWEERGESKQAQLTEIAWWFKVFSLHRNAIVHGSRIHREDRLFEGQRHVVIAGQRLLAALRRELVKATKKRRLLNSPHERRLQDLLRRQEPENDPAKE